MTNTKNFINRGYQTILVITVAAAGLFFTNPASARIAPARTAVADSASLAAFEGIYQQKDNEYAYIKVTAVNNTLVAKQAEGDQQFVLTRKSELVFETKDDDGDETITVTFAKDNGGAITQFNVGGKQFFTKVKDYVPAKAITLTAAQLKMFEGKYQFEERKDTYLQITATADGLTLKQMWDGKEIPFMPIADLAFLNRQMGFPLKFTKDANGNVVKVLAFNRDTWDKVNQ